MNHIDSAMRGIGMTAEYSNVSSGSHQVGIAIGHKEIEYDNIKKNVILISVGAAKNINEYQGFSKIGNSNWTNDSNYNENHYEAYERLSKVAYDKLKNYITSHSLSENVTYWVTGYGTGGGVANLLSARIIDTPPVNTSIRKVSNAVIFGYSSTTIGRMVDTGNTNIYTYTFGAPNVVYFDAEPEMINAAKYKSIFNVVDTNDVFAHLPSVKSGWGKYGWSMIPNDNYDKCKDIIDTYSKVFNDVDNKRDEIDINVFIYLYSAWEYNDLDNDTTFFDGMQKNQGQRFSTFYNKYYANYKDLEKNHSIKNYYSLCKKIRSEHMTIGDGWVDIKASSSGSSPQDKMAEALEVMGQQYVKNVSTYGDGHVTMYSLTQLSNDVEGAYKKNQYNTLKDVGISEQKDEIKRKFETLINNKNWFKCGDDCVRFMFSTIFYALDGDIGEEFSDNNNAKYYTMFGTNILTGNENDQLFRDLDFEIHYIGEVDEKGHEFGYEDLEDGDIVVAYRTDDIGKDNKGHIEFYINDKYGKNGNGTYDWGFGWGSQKKRYPVNGNIGKVIKEDTDSGFSVDINYKHKYLLDNFTNTSKDKTYDLRYFKVLRKVR